MGFPTSADVGGSDWIKGRETPAGGGSITARFIAAAVPPPGAGVVTETRFMPPVANLLAGTVAPN